MIFASAPMHLKTCSLLATLCIVPAAYAQGVVDIGSYGAKPGSGADATPAVRAALDACRQSRAAKLVFSAGQYDFWPTHASEKYLFVSNNDEGLKRIVFDLTGFNGLEIDGRGARFVFHRGVNPFLLDHARNITIRNLSLDWKRTFHSEAKIVAVGKDTVDLAISEAYPFKLENGLLIFTGEDKEVVAFQNVLEFDPVKRETAYMARDYRTGLNLQATEIGPRLVRVRIPKFEGTPGNILVFGASRRDFSAFTVTDSENFKLLSVNIYHCGGMGVIAQRSRDIELDQVRVTPSPGSGRVVSITADATHFVNCSGRIVMTNCLFENQKDDATNIHGIYAQVSAMLPDGELEVKLVHPQQRGFDFLAPGMKVELVHGPSMITYAEAVVRSAERRNSEYTRIRLTTPLPGALKIGDAVAAAGPYPEVVIRNCTIRGNRARGLLLGSRGKILIEDNTFHTAGAAILLEGDARYWFEQAGVRDLVIRRNRFEDCNYGVWGKAVIEVAAGIDSKERTGNGYNRNIVVEENLFRQFDTNPIVSAYCVDGLKVRKNRIEKSTAYPARNPGAKPFEISDSVNVQIEQD
ncbi:alpha-1,3-galactosidase-related protein [Paludibaculum fermentans]|uniref:right-handed parallel beta-helix repeat-containing protein n=1 Tax=Paludibaculum fermentans TaxID=1473598 RepID=UPI003EB7577D